MRDNNDVTGVTTAPTRLLQMTKTLNLLARIKAKSSLGFTFHLHVQAAIGIAAMLALMGDF